MPHCHQRLPFQNVVIQTGSPSNLFTRDSPPWFPRHSFRSFPSVTPEPLPTLPTLPSLSQPGANKQRPPVRRLLLQVQTLITCFPHQLPRNPVAHPCPSAHPFNPPVQKPPPQVSSGVPTGFNFPSVGFPPLGSCSPSPSPAPPMTR